MRKIRLHHYVIALLGGNGAMHGVGRPLTEG